MIIQIITVGIVSSFMNSRGYLLLGSIFLTLLTLFIFQNPLRQTGRYSNVLASKISVFDPVGTNQNNSAEHNRTVLNQTLFKKNQPFIKLEKFRVQFAHEGKCIGLSTDNDLQVSFCDPISNQDFYFSYEKLVADETSLCIGLNDTVSNKLALVDCQNALKLIFVNHTLQTEEQSCVSPLSGNTPTLDPKLGSAVALTKCDKRASKINLLEENKFLEDRKALIVPTTEDGNNTTCSRAANVRPAMAKLLPDSQVNRCSNLSECVTVVVKTARRPLLVVRMAESIRTVLHHDLPMIVIDDGPNPHPPKIQEQLSKYSSMIYVVANKPDLGISEGRLRGVKMVKTKYFANMDDDSVVIDSWNAERMVEILDKTDVSLVGTRAGSVDWPGFLNFECQDKVSPVLVQYCTSCRILNQTLPSFPECVRCDLSSNNFIAKTKDVLEVGGWSRELKIFEHHDLFLRLKAGGKKVMWCPNFMILNRHVKNSINKKYWILRYFRVRRMQKLFFNHWKIADHRLVNEFKKLPFL